ncbi:hypothetical protein LCGC14_1428080 [marine sediment metagenome]|uniref:Uncharacterized protein n=1 Tax=marine sediment metagenome TaxID=412755 RepID=A0A0F9JPF0_9ZZZZ
MDINRDVDQNDITRVFGSLTIFNQRVSDWWIQNPDFNQLLKRWNQNRDLISHGRIYEFFDMNFDSSYNGRNPVLDRFWFEAKNTIDSFLLLHDDYDLCYLLTDKDKDFLIRHFKL